MKTRRQRPSRKFEKMEQTGTPVAEINQAIRDQFGFSPATLWRFRQAVRGQPRNAWAPLLIPRWKGKTGVAEFTEAAWQYIKQEWGSQSKPDIAPIYRRALGLAKEHDWKIPSLDTVERKIRNLPTWWVALRREGNKALASLYPSQRRDYSTLKLHEMWCSDGRQADVFCRWPDGTVSRPIIVAWMDLRSRVCLGYEVGKVESADLIRLAFKKAAETSQAIPQAALMDNGHGFTSKLLTGGTPKRFRFQVKDEDIPGILTVLGVEVCWATPAHGQAKPIESWWRTLAQVDKRFRGAYCSNNPKSKPEEFDQRKAESIEKYLQLVQEEINAYHDRPHRGDSMDGQSPRQVYDALLAETTVRHPTPNQLRLCLLAAEAVRLASTDNAISLLGNRYWTEQLSSLRRDCTYVVRFNPEDAREPVFLYDGERFICEAPLIARTGFRDQQAAKDHNRARNKSVRARREQDRANREMHQAQQWTPTPACPDAGLPVPKVVQPVRPAMGAKPVIEEDDDLGLSQDKLDEIWNREISKRKAANSD
jgi:putative transposase